MTAALGGAGYALAAPRQCRLPARRPSPTAPYVPLRATTDWRTFRCLHACAARPVGQTDACLGESGMDGPVEPAQARAEDCPRCGAGLRFEDEDGTRECVCGWSEREPDPLADTPVPADGDDETLLV